MFAPYHEQPARYGDGPALEVAEGVFAADTTAAIAQLRLAAQTRISGQVLAAASMVQLAAGLATDPVSGYEELLAWLHQHNEPAGRTLSDLARALADPTGEFARLRELPSGDRGHRRLRVACPENRLARLPHQPPAKPRPDGRQLSRLAAQAGLGVGTLPQPILQRLTAATDEAAAVLNSTDAAAVLNSTWPWGVTRTGAG